MLGRLAWGNIRTGEHGVRPFLVLTSLACAAFYAFNTIEEQGALIKGGVDLPAGYADSMAGLTLFLAGTVGVVCVLVGRSASLTGRRQLEVLRTLGLGGTGFMRLLFMEQGMIALLGLVLGLALGIVVSQALVFVTAALLSGSVRGFAPFFSGRALRISALSVLLIFVITFVGTIAQLAVEHRLRHRPSRRRRRSMSGHPVALLVGGVACLPTSWAMFSLAGWGLGLPAMVAHPLALGLLWVASVLLFRGVIETFSSRWLPRSDRLGEPLPKGVDAFTFASMVDLARAASGSFALAAVGLAESIFSLASGMGVWGASVGELRSEALVRAAGPLSQQSQASMDSMSYLAAFAAAVLVPASLVLLVVLVREDMSGTRDGYRILHDLGCPSDGIAHSIALRVAVGFLLSWALGAIVALVIFLAEVPRLSVLGRFRLSLGLVWALAIVGIAVLACVIATSRSCGRVVARALRADLHR